MQGAFMQHTLWMFYSHGALHSNIIQVWSLMIMPIQCSWRFGVQMLNIKVTGVEL